MGYVIERVPKEEVRTYVLAPGYEVAPRTWIIDREKDIKLFRTHNSREEFEREHFALLWKEKQITFVLLKDFPEENTVRWRLANSLIIPYEYCLDTEVVLNELREAMQVFGAWGNPPIPTLPRREGKTIIDF